jgi:hypothetical protein
MRSAAAAALLICLLAFGGQFRSEARAGVQLDPLDTVTSDLNTDVTDVTDGVTDGVTDVTDSATGATSGATGAVNDAGSAVDDFVSGSTSVVSGSGSAATSSSTGESGSSSTGESGSASSGESSASTRSAKASNRGSPHTRFDRLPRRYEMLLERIESGRHVRASVARLRALLASASPELRARIMRVIRMEIRRLERGGLNRREQAAAERLRRLLPAPGPATWFGPSGAVSLSAGEAISFSAGDASVQVAGATAAPRLAGDPPANGATGTTHEPSRPLFPLPPPSGPAYWLLFLLAGIGAALLLVSRAPWRLIPSSVRAVEVPGIEASVLAVTIGLVVGVGVAFLVQALP